MDVRDRTMPSISTPRCHVARVRMPQAVLRGLPLFPTVSWACVVRALVPFLFCAYAFRQKTVRYDGEIRENGEMLRLLARLRQVQGERGDRAAVHPTCMQQRIVFFRRFAPLRELQVPLPRSFSTECCSFCLSSIDLVADTQLSKLRDTSGALVLYPIYCKVFGAFNLRCSGFDRPLAQAETVLFYLF